MTETTPVHPGNPYYGFISTTRGVEMRYPREDGKKDDQGKLRMDLVPPEAIEAIAEVLTYGARKYGENTWQNLPEFNRRQYAATLRHLLAWKKGQMLDAESGISHLQHALTDIAFLVWYETQIGRAHADNTNADPAE